MAMNHVLSPEREFRYIVMWFNEWSEMQREDFVPIVVDYLTKNGNGMNGGEVYMNGLVNGFVSHAAISDKPMSLFQCRVKLFREWSTKWPADFQNKLREKITEVDPKIGELIINEIKRHNNGGNHNLNDNEDHNSDFSGAAVSINGSEVNNDRECNAAQLLADTTTRAASDINEATIDDEPANNGLIDLLNNEKSVDDYDEEHNDNHGSSQHVDSNITVARATTIELVDQVIHDATELHEKEQELQQQANSNVTSSNNNSSTNVEVPLVA